MFDSLTNYLFKSSGKFSKGFLSTNKFSCIGEWAQKKPLQLQRLNVG
jgi:hypothetical protein